MFYWLILTALILIVIRFKFSGQKILYVGLITLGVGAVLGNFILSCGLLLMIVGLAKTLHEKK